MKSHRPWPFSQALMAALATTTERRSRRSDRRSCSETIQRWPLGPGKGRTDDYHLVIEHSHGIDDPFIDGLPIKNGDFPWLC